MLQIRRGWNACAIGCLLVSLLLLCSLAFAQNTRGVISGSIADKSGAVLKGARIELLPSGIAASANNQGEFVLRDIAPGHYTLTVSYIGFKTKNEEIDVVANKTLNLDLKLDVATKGEEIVVSESRGFGEAEAINQTRTADNIIDVLPADIITSLPNANVADALGRLPGVVLERAEGEGEYVDIRGLEPRLTNVTIDGITVPAPEPGIRQIRLDVINSDLVEAVEINKTLSANQDGDGIAGSVNLRTKMATEQPLLSVYGNGGYTPILGSREATQWGGVWGQRFGQAKKFGILIGGTYDYNGRGIDNIQPAIDPLSTMAQPFYDSNTIREYRYYRTRDGLSGSADYKLDDNNSFYAHGLFSDLKDWGDKWYYEPQSNVLIAPGVIAPGADSNGPKFYTSSKRPNASIGDLSLGGRHVRQNSWFTWEVAAARSYEVDSAGNPKATFKWLGTKPNCNYNPLAQTNVNTPTFGACDQANSPLLNANDWAMNELVTSKGLNSDLNLSAAASYARNYYVDGHFSTFEAGFKIRNGHQTQDATETQYDGWSLKNNPAILMSSLQSTFQNHEYYHGNYFGGQYGPVSDFNQASSYAVNNLGGYVDGAATAADTYPNIYHTVERITAGYAMNTIDFGKLHVQTGVRFEGTQMDTAGYTVALFPSGGSVPGIGSCTNSANGTGCGVATPAINNPSYLDALPSVQLRYSLSNNSVLRAVYSRGIARPDPGQLVPYATEDQTASPIALAIGNPSLKPEHANNYDLLYERYLHPLGMFQAGGFFKQLTSPEILLTGVPASLVPASMQSVVQQYNGSGDAITMYVNGENAYVYGFETAYQQHWSQLPGALKGLGVSANYTYTASQLKGIAGLRTDHPALQRQTPNSWNLGPTYDTKRISMRVGLQYTGASIYTYDWSASNDPSHLGPNGPSGDIYTYAHMQVDAQGSFKLGGGFTAMVYGLNLGNEVFGFYQGSTQFVNQREYYKSTYGGGLRYTLGER